ncbi:MAG: Histidine kinase protein [Chloroflexi bacterium]|nr:Histidine kinase protein [Chloroflexota bacterium]
MTAPLIAAGRGDYRGCADLIPEDQQQIERVIAALPLLADVSHADLVLYVPTEGGATVVYHAPPNPVPSLYPNLQTGRTLNRREPSPVFRVLRDGRGHHSLSGTLVWGAPTMQEVFPIQGAEGRVVAAVSSNANLLEHERFLGRGAIFRSMVARVLEQGFGGQIESAEHIGRLTEHDGALIVDPQGIIRYMSSVAENQYRRVGYVDNLLGGQISELDTNEYICFRSMERGVCLEQRVEEGDQVWIKRTIPLLPQPSKGFLRLLQPKARQPVGAAVFIQDITDEVRREQELKVKSAMIQEVHHRVKNNLQTLAFLLRMEAKRAKAPAVQNTLKQTIGRVLSIAVVHEFLSRGDNSEISIRDICNRIIGEMGDGLFTPHCRVSFSLVGTNFSLPAQQATSCALAMNELIQNATEHGFEGRQSGAIRVSLSETDASMVIEIVDDGIGFPANFDPLASPTLGLQIVRTLVQDDLRGHLDLVHDEGVTARISFPKELCRAAA